MELWSAGALRQFCSHFIQYSITPILGFFPVVQFVRRNVASPDSTRTCSGSFRRLKVED